MSDAPPEKKKRTKALSNAQKAYYERNREARLEQMKERAKQRTKEEKMACINDPDMLKVRRQQMLDKYYAYMMKDTENKIKAWQEDPKISKTFKAFLKENVEPVKTLLPRRFFAQLSKLSIAEKMPDTKPPVEVANGANSIAEQYAFSQSEKYF